MGIDVCIFEGLHMFVGILSILHAGNENYFIYLSSRNLKVHDFA